jgi:hypothetical protein
MALVSGGPYRMRWLGASFLVRQVASATRSLKRLSIRLTKDKE